MLVMLVFTGLRASEVRGLPWGNVDLNAGMIYLRQRAGPRLSDRHWQGREPQQYSQPEVGTSADQVRSYDRDRP